MKLHALAVVIGVALVPFQLARADDCHDVAKLKKDGNTAFGAAHYEEALAAYEKAYACDKDTSLLFNMAKADAKLGRYVAGLESMRRFQHESSDLPQPVRDAVQSALDDLQSHVGTISVHAPPSSVVSVGGLEIGKAPIEGLEVAAGPVTVHVVVPGHEPVDRRVDLKGGGHEVVDVTFTAKVVPSELAPSAPNPASSVHVHPLVWVGVGVTGAGLIVGIAAGASSLAKVSEIKKSCPANKCQGNIDADKSKANTLANVSNVGLAFAAAGAIAGGVGIGLTFRHTSDAQVSVGPSGVSFDGRF